MVVLKNNPLNFTGGLQVFRVAFRAVPEASPPEASADPSGGLTC